ncbi:hypothetical protein SteCoe_12318 [Stentor coeruleus]|uniref:Major facilitator superfamily (MFS) profile domain-containing protein n=1 Tax=Stentor coeruleus TaxID=5963 RepID=A0A1R2CAZ4_9CILI|nr:hypothetical protein SteCoe_12318 [Stentor coeruleus]
MVKLEFFTLRPLALLIIFSSVNLLIYIDRGALSSVLSRLMKSSNGGMDLTSLESGALGSLFILGYIIAAPPVFFTGLSQNFIMLASIGSLIWIVSVLFTGLSQNFIMLAIARSLTGIGEASFVCLAPPAILDTAPVQYKASWLGIYYSTTIFGYAIGFVFGDQVSAAFNRWSYPFLFEGIIMLPFVILTLLCNKDPKLYAKKPDGEHEKITTQICLLLKNYLFVSLCLGYAAYQFTVGGAGYWGPDFVESYYDVSAGTSSTFVGIITVLSGLIGTAIGSISVMRSTKKYELYCERGQLSKENLEFIIVEKCCFLLPVSISFALAIGILSLLASSWVSSPGNVITFLVLFGVSELFLFIITSPISMATMNCVPSHLRGQANALTVFFMHIFGDFPSPSIIGLFFESVGELSGMLFAMCWLIWAVLIWGFCWNVSRFHGKPWSFIKKNLFKKRPQNIHNETEIGAPMLEE